jgi:hypothetical protein
MVAAAQPSATQREKTLNTIHAVRINRFAMQRGTAEIFLGIGLIIMGILALKLTDLNYWWGLIALGAAVGSHGGISVSQRARA